MNDDANPRWREFPLDLADLCVKCAQCLPACPTWRLTHDEADSPRGRIALMQAATEGTVDDQGSVRRHLDRCLGCRHCEAICPAEVPYGELIDAATLAMYPGGRRGPWPMRFLRALLRRPALFHRVVVPLIRWSSWLPWRHRGLPGRARPAPGPGVYEPTGATPRGDAWLFLGCIARATDSDTLRAALDALRGAGYRVHVPAGQGCCGALHLHAGDAATHRACTDRNATAFDGNGPVVSCASGCAATLREDPRLGTRVTDISALLAAHAAPVMVGDEVTIHTPCTLASVQDQAGGPTRLLAGARAAPVRGRCCGAAGDYLLREPELAGRLRDETLDALAGATTVCTSNPGCAMFLRAGFAERGVEVAVRHPVLEWLRWKH